MKVLKYILVAVLFILISGFITFYLKPYNPIRIGIASLFFGFFVFNAIIRKSLSFKNYFTSPYNFLTSKIRSEKSFDIPKELMFEKIIEVINDSDFKVVEVDKENFEILAISSMTFKSWGENLYISFETNGSDTLMKFCSSTLFQVSSWGKNEKNYEDLLNHIENSLTV